MSECAKGHVSKYKTTSLFNFNHRLFSWRSPNTYRRKFVKITWNCFVKKLFYVTNYARKHFFFCAKGPMVYQHYFMSLGTTDAMRKKPQNSPGKKKLFVEKKKQNFPSWKSKELPRFFFKVSEKNISAQEKKQNTFSMALFSQVRI